MKILKNPGSFRDPAGQVFEYNGRTIRIIKYFGKKRYDFLLQNEILKESIEKKFIIPTKDVTDELKHLKIKDACYYLEHEKIDYISYPYEWGFYQLKDAALHHLNFQIFLLEKKVKLIDSSAFNIQFINHKPIFIDILSLDEYYEGEYWIGHSQFLKQFLNPLLLRSKKGILFNNWYKGNLDGISTSDLNSILNFKDKFSFNIFFSVVLLSIFEEKNKFNPKKAITAIKNKKSLSKNSYRSMLLQLKNWIEKLEPLKKKTDWDNYSIKNTYKKYEENKKLSTVNLFVNKNKLKFVADIGCNDGLYSIECLKAGVKKVIGFDIDINSIDRAFVKSKNKNLNFLPLYLDAMNPSSKLGWNETERMSFNERLHFDGVIALAFEHHLALRYNVPLNEVIDWLTNIAPKGLIEFVDKKDETVQQMLSLKGDIFSDYNQIEFEKHMLKSAEIINKTNLTETRTLYEFKKR